MTEPWLMRIRYIARSFSHGSCRKGPRW